MGYTGDQKRDYDRKWMAARRLKCLELFGNRCCECGVVEKLQFDHIDPFLKKFNIAHILSRKWEFIEKELAKCQLLCEACHLKKTLAQRPSSRFCPNGHDTEIVGRKIASGGGCRECAREDDRRRRLRKKQLSEFA